MAFVLHLILPVHPIALNVALSPLHKLVLLAEITGADGFTPVPIVSDADAGLVPHSLLQVAVYVPALVILILLPVAPVLHAIVPLQLDAERVADSVPHKIVLLLTITGAGGIIQPQSVFTLIMIGAEAVLVPQVFLQIAVYVPAADADTDKVLPVTPELQVTTPEHPFAVNNATSVVQISVLFVVTFGADGLPPVVIVILSEAILVPQSFLHIAL